MPTDDTARRQLYTSLETLMGRDNAGILMDHLPPAGWQDLATRRDLDNSLRILAEELRREFSEAMNRQTWRLVTAMIASQAVIATVLGIVVSTTA